MKVIGITGGVGCGKSRVMAYLKRRFGAGIILADEVAHRLMEPGGACYKEILFLLGEGYTDGNGVFDKGKLAGRLFTDDTVRMKIDGIVHPAVKRHIRAVIETEQEKGTKLFFVEAALLIEDHYNEICDELWYIHADADVRKRRLMRDRGYSEDKVAAIMAKQLTEAEFTRGTDYKLDNSGDFDATIAQLESKMRGIDETM